MKRLLIIECQKLWLNKLSRSLIIIYFFLLISIALIAILEFELGPIKLNIADEGIFNFPYIWHFNTYIASLFKLFLAILIISMIGNEYNNRTLKQNLIDGLSKKEFIASKFLIATTISLCSSIFVFITSLLLGLLFSEKTSLNLVFTDCEFIIAYFIKHIGFLSFCIFIGILIKRSAFALGFLILWNILEWIMYGLLYWSFDKESNLPDNIANLFPFRAMSNLIDKPFTRLSTVKNIAKQVGEKLEYNYTMQWKELIIVISLSLLFMYLSYKLLLKRDL
jgi:ABC-type transport system involved in multi-copper enzyme maturation permease subunit